MGARKTEIAEKPAGAHYLHGRKGLEAVLRVPVSNPSSLCWVPRKELLLVGTTDGEVVEVDPVMGTRPRCSLGGPPHKLAVDDRGQRYVALLSDGAWCAGELGEKAPMYTGTSDLNNDTQVFFLGDYLVLFGDSPEGRAVVILKDGVEVRRIAIPLKTHVFAGTDGKVWYARSTHRGLERGRLTGKSRFSESETTEHVLFATSNYVLGWTEYGAVVWGLSDGAVTSFSLLDLNRGSICSTGDWVAFGTVGGVVALVNMSTFETRKMPFLTKAHDKPIHSVAFSSRGRWFATAGARVQLWSWETNEAP